MTFVVSLGNQTFWLKIISRELVLLKRISPIKSYLENITVFTELSMYYLEDIKKYVSPKRYYQNNCLLPKWCCQLNFYINGVIKQSFS